MMTAIMLNTISDDDSIGSTGTVPTIP